MAKPTIIVEVSGGVCQAVYATVDLNVRVMDWDNAKEDDDYRDDCTKLAKRAKQMKQVF